MKKGNSYLIPVLVDSSTWIDFFKGVEHSSTKFLATLIELNHAAICPIIIQEVLQGIRNDEDYHAVKENFLGINILTLDQVDSAIGAADIYRALRKTGITIRKSNDCVIAYYCLALGMPLLSSDKDFNKIASEFDLKIIHPVS
jgi:predicted nucleic acid-binding protein